MTLLPFCQWLAETPGSIALHESLFMYPLVESLHVLTLTLFVGMTLLLDLRLLGIKMPGIPVTEVRGRLLPIMLTGFVVMVVSGLMLFYAIPVRSYQNVFFRLKMITFVLAGLNAAVFHWFVEPDVGRWDTARVPPRPARVAGAASLICWAIIIVSGRLIAYNWFDCDVQPQPKVINWAAGCVVKGR